LKSIPQVSVAVVRIPPLYTVSGRNGNEVVESAASQAFARGQHIDMPNGKLPSLPDVILVTFT